MPNVPTPASLQLRALAARISAPFVALPGARAAMLSGSAAEGLSDGYSDLDMTVYYDALPSEEQLAQARSIAGGGAREWVLGDRDAGSFAESFMVDGVECQIGHATIAVWEGDIGVVLEQLDVETPLQKALEGTLHGIPLAGAPLIEGWQTRIAAYPDQLGLKMVKHYLRFPPLWYLGERVLSRDATLWRHQMFVEIGHNLLAVLAGLNHVYFSAFQFKRAARFAERLALKPPQLAERLDACFAMEPRAAVDVLEQLVAETVALVEAQLPDVDTSRVRRRLGQRQAPWSLP